MNFKIIDIHQAKKLIDDQSAFVIDIRDPQSFEEAHIPSAVHISQENIETFIQNSDKSKSFICYCYHGISSQNAAQFLCDQGFTVVYSLQGGFEEWRSSYPSSSELSS